MPVFDPDWRYNPEEREMRREIRESSVPVHPVAADLDILMTEDRLTDWEREFVGRVYLLIETGRGLTRRQAEKVNQILRRWGSKNRVSGR